MLVTCCYYRRYKVYWSLEEGTHPNFEGVRGWLDVSHLTCYVVLEEERT